MGEETTKEAGPGCPPGRKNKTYTTTIPKEAETIAASILNEIIEDVTKKGSGDEPETARPILQAKRGRGCPLSSKNKTSKLRKEATAVAEGLINDIIGKIIDLEAKAEARAEDSDMDIEDFPG